MMSFEDLVIDLSGLGRQGIRLDLKLGNNIDQGADAAFQLQEFVEDYHFLKKKKKKTKKLNQK